MTVDPPGESRVPVSCLLRHLLDGEALVDEEADERVAHRMRRGRIDPGVFDRPVPVLPSPVAGSKRITVWASYFPRKKS